MDSSKNKGGKVMFTVVPQDKLVKQNDDFATDYLDLAKMAVEEQKFLRAVIERDPYLYRRLDFNNVDLRRYLEMSLVLSEVEELITTIPQDCSELDRVEHSLQLAKKSRDLREAVNQLWSSTVLAKLSYGDIEIEKLGIHASVGDEYLEFEFPFEMLALSDLHITNLKKYTRVDQLVNSRHAWTNIMASAMARIPMQYRKTIYDAEIRVSVLTNKRRMSDPDHFWMRPVIDSFARFGVILDDRPSLCKFSVQFEFGYKEPFLNIQVGQRKKNGFPNIRNESLVNIF